MNGNRQINEAALARLRGFLGLDPDNWNLRAEVFDAALAAGDQEAAREQVEHALTQRPDDPGWLHRQAMLYLARGEPAQAQGVLEGLLARGYDAPAIRHNLGYALFEQGRWEAARDAVSTVIGTPDESAAASLVLWLRCQHRIDRLDDALETFRLVSSKAPVPPDAWGAASLIALDAGRLDEARAWSQRALQGTGDQLEALAARGTLALAAQDAKGAAESFSAAVRVNAADGRSWSGLAFARMLVGDLGGASDAFVKALAAMPEHQGTWIGLGWCQVLTGDAESARKTFERALEIDRNIAEVHGGLAVALARAGDGARAQAEIEIATRLDRSNLSARYAEAVLSGEADDPKAFQRFARNVLRERSFDEDSAGSRSLQDVVFGRWRGPVE